MTREFNTHRRNNSPLPPHNRPSGRDNETRPPQRPGRHRLSRAEVDRGWESGAQINHADYRPRNGNGQTSHTNRRNYQSTSRPSSSPNASGNYRSQGNQGRSYDNRREGYQGNQPRDRFAGPGRYSSDERHFRDEPGRYSSDERRFRGERSQPQNSRGQNAGRDSRPPREYDRRGPRPYERGASKPFNQSRPTRNAQRPARRPQRFTEQFEGDYERFNDDEDDIPHPSPRPSGRPFRGERGNRASYEQPPEERHVTRLPDGRVLKGPRAVQRRDAEFWTEVAEDTDELLGQVHTPISPRHGGKRAGAKAERKTNSAPRSTARAKAAPEDSAPRPLNAYRKAGPRPGGPRAAGSRPPQRRFRGSAH
jgi:hypothetical protein